MPSVAASGSALGVAEECNYAVYFIAFRYLSLIVSLRHFNN